MVSAHWETEGTWVTGMDQPKTIHDFRGFPEELYQIQYPAPGDPRLAVDIANAIPGVSVEMMKWGLDHGTWAVLRHVFPAADVPIIQLSLDMTKPLSQHLELGRRLRPVREHGVMIVGSGNIVHNLRQIDWDRDAKPHGWNEEFDQWVADHIRKRDFEPLISMARQTPAGQLSIPTLEHYLPLLYVLGASDEADTMEFIFEGYQNASMSMRCVSFGV